MELRELKQKISDLEWWQNDPRVKALRQTIQRERQPQIDALKAQIVAIPKRAKKLRWEPNTPQHIISACEGYWKGTTELSTFRIHLWNDKAVWTSYPNSVYYTNGGANKAPAAFFLISLVEQDRRLGRSAGKVLAEHEGRFGKKEMARILLEKTA